MILYRLEISPETYHQKFRAKKKVELRPRLLAQSLRDLVECCLHPEERTMVEITDLIVLEQFLVDLGDQIQRWVRRR